VLLHSLPVRDPQRLVLVDWRGYQVTVNAFGSSNLEPYPLCRELQQQDRFFEGVFCRALTTITLSTGGEYAPAQAEVVSGSYFPVLGIRAARGRLFTNDDDQAPGANPVVVLSHDYWKSQFGGAPDVVGKGAGEPPSDDDYRCGRRGLSRDRRRTSTLALDSRFDVEPSHPRFRQYVEPPRALDADPGTSSPRCKPRSGASGFAAWFKAMLDEDTRLPDFPNVTAEDRRRFLASAILLIPAAQGHSYVRRQLTQPLLVLYAATLVLLGLACMNVAGLFLVRGSARERELRTRLALGASRGRIGRQLLADSLLIALAGGLLGIALAPAAIMR